MKNKNSLQLASQSAFSDEEDEPVKFTKPKTVSRGRGTKSSQASSRVTNDIPESTHVQVKQLHGGGRGFLLSR
jgi:hypothetical protein